MDHSHPAPEGSRAGPLPEPPESVAVPEQVAEAAGRASRGGGLATMFRIDVAPLRRSREFRLLFIGQGVGDQDRETPYHLFAIGELGAVAL